MPSNTDTPSNFVNLTIPGNSAGVITCVANATYYQVVTLTWLGNNSIQFTNSGEATPMSMYTTGATSFALLPAQQAYQMKVVFEYSRTGRNGVLFNSEVSDPITITSGGATLITVRAENGSDNGSDNDYNVSFLTIVLFSQAPSKTT